MKRLVFSITFLTLSAGAVELRRETPYEFKPCNRTEFITVLPKSLTYVTDMARRIMHANPSVFNGDLATENFCFGIKYNENGRAWANAETRSFVMDTGMLTRVQNDAQLAFVVSHELAHVSLRHFHGGYPVSGPAISAADAALREIRAQMMLESNRTHEASERLNDEEHRHQAVIDDAIRAQFGEITGNWEEGEADRAGAQFYLAAGFTKDEIAWRSQQVVITDERNEDPHSPPPQISAQERISQAYAGCDVTNIASMSEPARGGGPYPNQCWTIWNLIHNAPATDGTCRSLMNDARSIVNLDLPEESNLNAVKAEVAAYVHPNPKASLTTKRSRMPASVQSQKQSTKNKKHPHEGCF